MAEVKVGLGTVLGDIDLTVLIGAHGAGVNIDIGVELLSRDLQPPCLSSLPSEAAVMPLPRPDTTPPVTKMYFVLFIYYYSLLNRAIE